MAASSKKKHSKASVADSGGQLSPAERLKALGNMTTSGTVSAAAVMEAFQANLNGREAGFEPIYTSLVERVEKVQAGELGIVESMLFSQAQALQTIFSSLARRAANQEYMKQYQTYLVLALKAQSQCRATLEALAEIKNPRPVMFAKQANITSGHQQVNNGTAAESGTVRADAHAPARENSSPQNELLEQQHGNRLDTRAPSTAGGADPHLEAVAAGHRAAHA